MKVLFDHPWPFALAHGGFQIQIEQTKAALERRGIEVDYIRWWDSQQTGQIIHYFGRPNGGYVDYARAKGLRVVVGELHTGLGSRSLAARTLQKTLMDVSRKILPTAFTAKLAWDAYQKADGFVALTDWEANIMCKMFGANSERIRVIPNGVEDVFFPPHTAAKKAEKLDYLVCTASIHSRKRVLELAEAAGRARVPIWIIGKPYAESESYYQHFLQTQKRYPDFIRYEGAISDRAALAAIYQKARGFVLLSTMESLSLSSLEAAAGGCPLLLSDLPWARSVFGVQAAYCPVNLDAKSLSKFLIEFHANAPSSPKTFQPLTWDEVAGQLEAFYRTILSD